jgi:hypothetical protein
VPDLLSTRWLRLPRGRALLRWTAVAVLLTLAAGVLLAGGETPPCPPMNGPTLNGSTTPGATTPATPATLAPEPGESAAVPSLGVPAGTVGVLVRLADPAAAVVLRPGSRVDLLPGPPAAALRDVLVLAVVAGGLFDQPGAAALLIAVPAERVPVGSDATTVTYGVVVRTG